MEPFIGLCNLSKKAIVQKMYHVRGEQYNVHIYMGYRCDETEVGPFGCWRKD